MTYLFKLSRRAASGYLVSGLLLAAMACSEAAPREFLTPDSNTPSQPAGPVAVLVAPSTQNLPFDQTIVFAAWGRQANGDSIPVAVNWTATGGQIASDGTYRGTKPGTHTISAYAVGKPTLFGSAVITVSDPGPLFSSLTVRPNPVVVGGGSRVVFAATAMLQSGANTLPAVTWSTTGGLIAPSGEYEAPYQPGVYQVVATSLDGLVSDTVQVQVEAAALTALQLAPRVVTMPGGATQDFTIAASWSDGGNAIPVVEWQAGGGTMLSLPGATDPGNGQGGGRFKADKQPGNYKVVVRNPSSGKSDTASVTITAILDRVELTPAAVSLLPGASVGFEARGWMTDGSPAAVTVSWSATGGTVSGSGLYSAGSAPGTYRVIARTTDGSLADTSVVQISQPSATLTGLSLTPASGTAAVGQVVAFAAQASWSDGSTNLPQVTWSAQAGSISQDGHWTAPATTGSYRVIVRQSGGTVADTALMNVVVPPPSLATLRVSPKSPAVIGGSAVDFAAQATWTDGSTTLPPLSWTATGGTVSAGHWVAPNVSGVYRVVARQTGGSIADTAVVTVSETPRVIAINLTPGVAALVPKATQQFNAQATWSDGVAREVDFAWTATGGTITVGGLFTAGSLAGQFAVIVSCAACSVADTSFVTITEPVVPAPVVTQIVLNPSNFSLGAGEGRELNVAASWSDGSTTVPPLTWTVTGGTLTGLTYAAGNTPGNYLVIARHTGSTVADTAFVTITGGAATAPSLSSLSLNPSSVTLAPGAQRTMTVAATWSDGSTTLPPLTWSATGGTMNGLVYTAGSTVGAYQVVVAEQGGAMADTTVVIIQAAAPATLLTLAVSPAAATVPAGGSLQFTATGTWSDSSVTSPVVNWSATGGTISSGGLYVAGGTTGTFQVTALDPVSGKTAQQSVTITPAQAWVAVEPELPRATVDVTYPALTGTTINVPAGGNLQSAINNATCGDEIVLAAGATFTGNFNLPKKGCSGWIVIRTGTLLPAAGVRVTPTMAAQFAKILTPDAGSAISAESGAAKYRIVGVEVSAAAGVTQTYSLVNIHGSNPQTLAEIPSDFILDRVYVHGTANLGFQRCVMLDALRSAVIDSHLSDCHGKGFDSQALLVYNSPGPILVSNNYLEGAGENVMFGGADPSISGLIPSDITVTRNHFFKPLSWKGVWTVKNLFEIKNAQRVLLEGNVFENTWVDGQSDAIVFKSAQAGNAPWSTGSDITFRYNIVRNAPRALNVAASPGANPTVPAARIKIEHNLFEDIGNANGTTGNYFGLFLGALRDVQVLHNTAITNITTSLATFDGNRNAGPPADRLVFADNHVSLGQYGIFGSGVGAGSIAFTSYWQSWEARGNVFVSNTSPNNYPAGNTFTGSSSNPVAGLGRNGGTPGVDYTVLNTKTAGVK